MLSQFMTLNADFKFKKGIQYREEYVPWFLDMSAVGHSTHYLLL